MNPQSAHKGFLPFFWDIAKVIVLSLVIILPIRYFIVQPFFVRGASMEPTYYQGDYLLIDEISYRLFEDPRRGDVIVFRYPNDTSQFYIKRVIGLPGETIILSGVQVSIVNGEFPEGLVLEEPYINDRTFSDLRITLEEDEYFVLGDNRDASYDSRRWGVLEKRYIVGRALVRAWPLDKIGLLEAPSY